MLKVVILLAGVILAVVIGTGVVLALVARIRTRRSRKGLESATRAPRQPAPQPTPPAPAPPRPDATRVVDVAAPKRDLTEQVDWYGMLVCTVGPLQGKKFIIEDDGFWIGREPSMSQVVVEDSRISRQHVRIVPRDGQVRAIDFDSKNGTFIDQLGNRITEVTLTKGATIILADNAAAFRYQI